LLLLTACSAATTATAGDKLKVLATTSIVGDVVNQVGGDTISLNIMMPVGTDPHDFQPRPQDAAILADAQVIFSNGAGLEQFLQPMFQSSGATGKLVEVSQGIALLTMPGDNQSSSDPHTWMDPNNVIIWTQNIASTLSAVDSTHASMFQANAAAYIASLNDLDTWIRTQVAQVPPQDRLLVEDHAVLGYFANRYGFTQVGTITGSFSSEAAPSAQEVAALEDKIHQMGVKAIIVSETINQSIADQIATDTGIKTVFIYHASLSAPNGPAANYLEFMRYNVNAIVEALK
jgi:manganese/iron transport system substrate-binding protein